MHNAVVTSGVEADYKTILEEGFRQMAVQLPSFIIITVFILVLINLIITFPILRKFKVATPILNLYLLGSLTVHYCGYIWLFYFV